MEHSSGPLALVLQREGQGGDWHTHTHTADRAAANLKQTLVEVQRGVVAGCAPVEALRKDKAVCTLSWFTRAYTHTLG